MPYNLHQNVVQSSKLTYHSISEAAERSSGSLGSKAILFRLSVLELSLNPMVRLVPIGTYIQTLLSG
jgi:hypothetical protein